MSNCARRALVTETPNNPMTTVMELQSSFAEMGEPARGQQSLQHFINRGFMGEWPCRKPLLRKRHMTAHLEFAKWDVKDS